MRGGDEKGLCRGGEKRGKGGQGADGALDGGRSAERGEEERGASQRVAVGPSALSIVLLLSCSRSFSLALRWHDRRVMSVYTELPPSKKTANNRYQCARAGYAFEIFSQTTCNTTIFDENLAWIRVLPTFEE